VREAADTIF